MPYIHFTDEQKHRANSVDLVDFLLRQGEKLIASGRDKRIASDPSITVRGSEWYDHSRGKEQGGYPIDFVQFFYGLSFPEAVTRLLGGEQGVAYTPAAPRRQEPKKTFALPEAGDTMRRLYAYLLNKRYISRDILTHFVREKLLYESCELSKDKTKQYHNAVFVGTDEHGVPRHAHKRSLYGDGPSFRCNVESSNPAYSFHYTGTSDRLYVFEAPIDMLSFLSLHPRGWQEHSYVALCGVAEHAMLKILELNPQLQKVALCLDHDEAGIEAAGRLTDILGEKGYTMVGVLQSAYKDWNEDVKAGLNFPAEPAEDHPQLAVCGGICQRVAEMSCSVKSDLFDRQIPALLTQCKGHLHWGRFDKAAECFEQMAALSLSAAVREYRQIEQTVEPQELADTLQSSFRPHQNKGKLTHRTDRLATRLQSVLAQSSAVGIRSLPDKQRQAKSYMDFALDCVGALVQMEAESQKQEQEQIITME